MPRHALVPEDRAWCDAASRWVRAVEQAYVDAATAGVGDVTLPRWIAASDVPLLGAAAAGAIASRFLAVSAPRSIGLIGDAMTNALSLAAHRVWFKPTDVRCHGDVVDGGRAVSIDEALAADIVCIHEATVVFPHQIRRGTHVNALALVPVERMPRTERVTRVNAVTVDPELAAVVVREDTDLPAMAAGFRDGRQLDEITLFVLDSAAVATGAMFKFPPPY